MLTAEENELICRVGPGTPMGDVMRRYWHPLIISDELPEPDCAPIRARLLGEDLVAFRDTNGDVGLLADSCPHRGASLFFGINQECGLMCIYHGWKFDVNGNCVDMPSDIPGSNFIDKVHATSYPAIESAGVIWAYMGPKEHQPAPPNFVFNNLPADHVVAFRVPIYCNYLQSMEGNIDSTHLGTLHVYHQDKVPVDLETDKPGYPSGKFSLYTRAKYRYARVDVQDTDYGFRLIAERPTDAGNKHLRINCFSLPYTAFIASPGMGGGVLIQVPIDDETNQRVGIRYNVNTPFTAAERMSTIQQGALMDPAEPKKRLKRIDNDYMLDRWAQKNTILAGIWPIPEQDYALIETMGPIYDRSKEHLYGGDAAIIRCRQMLLSMVRGFQEGKPLPGLDPAIQTHKIRSEEIIVGPDDDPWLVATDAGETSKRGERLR
jgi:phthalate 4,5-dioxygenase oxygenase subunit